MKNICCFLARKNLGVLFFLGLFSSIANFSYSGSVDSSTAAVASQQFFRSISSSKSGKLPVIESLSLIGDGCLYAVNFKGGGFVLLSSESRTKAILGFSPVNTFPTDTMPYEIHNWIWEYEEQVKGIRSLKTSNDKMNSEWEALLNGTFSFSAKASVSPLLTSNWDQGCYYNDFCPYDASVPPLCRHVYTGCAATALGQLLYYWKYPLQPEGSKTYDCSYGQLSVDFDTESYDFSAMKDYLGFGDNETETAKLLYHCGIAMEMDYSTEGSATGHWRVSLALNNYFGYKAINVSRGESFTDKEWEELLKTEINAGNPVFMSGYSGGTGPGHAFICDGYIDSLFHFNWGWGSAYNGYFLISDMNPNDYDFSNSHEIVLAQPDLYDIVVDALIGQSNVINGNQYDLNVNLVNNGQDWEGDVYLNLYNNSNKLIETIGTISDVSLDSSQSMEFQFTNKEFLYESGTYNYRIDLSINGRLTHADVISYSNPQIVNIRPPSPILTASEGEIENHIVVTWDKVPICDYYKLYRSTNNNAYWAEEISGFSWINDTAYTDTNISIDKQYYYWAKASDNNTGRYPSTYSSFCVGWAGLNAPVLEITSDSKHSITLNWNIINEAYYYKLYKNSTEDISNATEITEWDKTDSYIDYDVDSNIVYYYWIKVCADTTDDLIDCSESYPGLVTISPPTGMSATKGEHDDYVFVSWKPTREGFCYLVYRNTFDNFLYSTPISLWSKDTFHFDSTVNNYHKYYYWVQSAFDSSGSLFSNFSALDTGYATIHVGTKEEDNKPSIKVYPLPPEDYIIIQLPSIAMTNRQIQIIDLSGKIVLEDEITIGIEIHKLDVRALQKGVYVLTILGDESDFTMKIIIN